MYNHAMNTHTMITSPQNQQIQLVRKLMEQSKARERNQAFVAEGVRLVEEGVNSSFPLKFILHKPMPSQRAQSFLESLSDDHLVLSVEPKLFDSVSSTEHSQGILAVFELLTLPLPADLNFIVILDQLRDPGNMGTILRSAEAAGAQAVIVPRGNTDPFAPKVVRAGMGAHFRLPIQQLPWEVIDALTENLSVFHADMNGELSCWQANFRQPLALLIGGEAEGISPEGQQLATHSVCIPMRGKTESLNAAVSASVLMFEVSRQRFGE
ncbi:MAG: RNA methyltransferase [Chloroflexi bacterium]|jgi:TrmH family RNA methyltransferase|nr:RNA methyltransferase [Chloroflexota bacterium]